MKPLTLTHIRSGVTRELTQDELRAYFAEQRTHIAFARRHRASRAPLLTWALVIFFAGVLLGIAVSRATSVLTAESSISSPALRNGATSGLDGSAARAERMVEARAAEDIGPLHGSERPASTGPSSIDFARATSLEAAVGRGPLTRSDRGDAGHEVPRDGDDSHDVVGLIGEGRARLAYSRPDLEAIIRGAFRERGLDADRAIAVAVCESGLRVDAIGDSGAAVGIFQFHEATFRANARRLTGRDIGDQRTDPVWSSLVAAYMFSIGQEGQWTCAHAGGGTP